MAGSLNMVAAARPMSDVEQYLHSWRVMNLTAPFLSGFQLAGSSKFSKNAHGRTMENGRPACDRRYASSATFALRWWAWSSKHSASATLMKIRWSTPAAWAASMAALPYSTSRATLPPAARKKSVSMKAFLAPDSANARSRSARTV